MPAFVTRPSRQPFPALYFIPDGRPETFSEPTALSISDGTSSYSITPAEMTYFSPRPLRSGSRKQSFAPVRLSTTIVNFFSMAFLTVVFVSFAVTTYVPGFVAVP